MLLRPLGIRDRALNGSDFFARRASFCIRRLGRAFRLGPARVEQPRLDAADLRAELAIPLGRARLPPERRRTLLLLAQDFAEADEIGFSRAQLLLGILAPRIEPGNAGGLLEQEAPFDRLGRDHRANLALANERRRMRASSGVGEQQGDVLRTDVAPVDPVRRTRAAFDPPSDFAFAAAAVLGRVPLEQDRDFREIARRPRRRPGEDYVVHAPAAQRLRAGFTHRPADRLEEVGFAAAVRPDNPGQARFNAKFGWLDEALEAAELEPADSQRLLPSPTLTSSPGGFQLRFELLPRRRVGHLAVDEESRCVVDARAFRSLRDVEQPFKRLRIGEALPRPRRSHSEPRGNLRKTRDLPQANDPLCVGHLLDLGLLRSIHFIDLVDPLRLGRVDHL